jgi:predicted DNA-binding transcriptional regulator YafY
MQNQIFRSEAERFELFSKIASTVPVGHNNRITIGNIVRALSSSFQGNKNDPAFKKEIERCCNKIRKDYKNEEGVGLVKVARKGLQTHYYWADEDDKHASIELFTITRPRALAMFLVKEHISDILPASFLSALSSDFKLAEAKLKNDGVRLSDVLDYSPFGFSMVKAEQTSSPETEAIFNVVFESLLSHTVIKIGYRSIHPEYASQGMYVSGQKLRYLNSNLQLLAYEHASKSTKHFALSKITSIELAGDIPFVKLATSEYESEHTLKIRCHTWVKDSFESSRLGSHLTTVYLDNDVWELSDSVKFPVHFNNRRPDGFYIANFLSMFADSVEVLAPSFLRDEMHRRSCALNSLYSKTNSASVNERLEIVSNSPHNIAKLNSP